MAWKHYQKVPICRCQRCCGYLRRTYHSNHQKSRYPRPHWNFQKDQGSRKKSQRWKARPFWIYRWNFYHQQPGNVRNKHCEFNHQPTSSQHLRCGQDREKNPAFIRPRAIPNCRCDVNNRFLRPPSSGRSSCSPMDDQNKALPGKPIPHASMI